MMASLFHDNIIAVAIAWIFSIIGTITNLIVIYIVKTQIHRLHGIFSVSSVSNVIRIRNSRRSKTFLIFIVNLAISDFLGSLYLMILASADLFYRSMKWPVANSTNEYYFNTTTGIPMIWLKQPMCYIARSLLTLSISQSTILTVLIASERFLLIVCPFSSIIHITSKKAIIYCLISWNFSIILAVICNVVAAITLSPSAIIVNYYQSLCYIDNLGYFPVRIFYFILMVLGLLAYTIIISMYAAIAYKFQYSQHRTRIRTFHYSIPKLPKKALYLTYTIGMTNILAWFPAFIVGLTIFFNYQLFVQSTTFQSIIVTIHLIHQVKSSINPIIFLISLYKKH